MFSNSLRPEDTRALAQIDMINFVGYHRKANEDNCCINDYFIPLSDINHNVEISTRHTEHHHLYGVFDGVGGDDSGEVASLAAAHFFANMNLDEIDRWNEDLPLVEDTFRRANAQVNAYAKGSATTAVLLGVSGSCGYVLHLGDSRCYLLRNGKLTCLTQDDTAPQGPNDERSHCITRYLGAPENQPTCLPMPARMVPLEVGDTFLLCSDGLTDLVDDAVLQDLMTTEDTTQHQRVIALVQSALKNGGFDNITAMLVHFAALER